jgi:hypothetical protein
LRIKKGAWEVNEKKGKRSQSKSKTRGTANIPLIEQLTLDILQFLQPESLEKAVGKVPSLVKAASKLLSLVKAPKPLASLLVPKAAVHRKMKEQAMGLAKGKATSQVRSVGKAKQE